MVSLFDGTTGKLLKDSVTLYYDITNQRLGIGTSSPTGNIHIVGKSDGTASMKFEKTGTNAGIFQIYNDGFANIV